ncbi:NAD(P)H-dependent oxidoreductase [Halotalea alkalilenta]|uniref:Flagellar biosynthesis protein FlgA n=1 Tax=Halotalea alkalilenta TaxID=376489 RepID=A0A172YAF7_9GAMM|nr:SAF domain-containing protein [Halotalea alkalilenta]ANF56209.1 flagellar biosynthesis protein FlgA [Halotalea alkalilenta]
MNLEHYFDHGDSSRGERVVEACVVGSGGFGRSLLVHAPRVPGLDARVAVDLDLDTAVAALRAAGRPLDQIHVCREPTEARRAWDAGHCVVTDSLAMALSLPFDMVVEATGQPEAGARHAVLAIEAGRHLALASKEVDSVVGPMLAEMARERGCIVTPVDGDQPSLLLGLISWAERVGLEVISAGKASEYDFIYDPCARTLECDGRRIDASGLDTLWQRGGQPLAEWLAARAQLAAALPQRAVPDLCELGLVANHSALVPDQPSLHCPIARLGEVADIFERRELGGLLAGEGRIDVFNCLRRVDEFSPAGGVFVNVRCHDRESWRMLAAKGHLVARDGNAATILLPRHLLGLEVATSLFEAVLNGVSSGARVPKPRFDLVGIAERDLPAGTALTAHGHHHTIDHLRPALVPAAALAEEAPLPFYLAATGRLRRAVAAGEPIRGGDVELDETSMLWRLRHQQDARFLACADTRYA